MMIVPVLLMTFASSLGAFFFKKSTDRAAGLFSLLRIPAFYLGGCFYVLGALLNVLLLRFMEYTVLYPMASIGYIWSLLLANRFLGERITKKKLFGIGLICLGIMLLTR